MLFKKLFRILVLGGAVAGTATGCATTAQGQKPASQKEGADASAEGTKPAPKDSGGGGVQGW
jgi:hypothetical protein